MAVKIEGTCDPKFNRVKDVFAENFEKRNEVGAATAVMLDGKSVVDIWAGHADKEKTKPWTRDTLVNVYSTTKGITAICAHRLADKGLLDIDAPVAKYWPEFAQAGKDKLPVRFLLSHRAGLPAVRKILNDNALFNWTTMTTALAEQEPWWEPGTAHGYHAVTFGYLVGEVIRRITGKSPGTYLRDELAGPLDLDFHIGLDAKDDARVAGLIPAAPPGPGEPNMFAEMMKNPESAGAKAFMNPPVLTKPGLVNSREWRAAEIPAANGHGTARSLARLYGALARGGELDGVRVMSKDQIAKCSIEQSRRVADNQHALLPRLHDVAAGRVVGPESEIIRTSGRRRLAWIRRSRRENRVWLHDEQDAEQLADRFAPARADRCGLRFAVVELRSG
jgi:CubicO group peptidase (beta-lactamase class C family)